MPLVAEYAEARATGVTTGAYALYGDVLPYGTQDYQHDFWFPYADMVSVDALRAKSGKRGILKKLEWDNSQRETVATLVEVNPTSTFEDNVWRRVRYTCRFAAEPLWYAGGSSTVNFSGVSTVNLTGNNINRGNFRCIKWLILTFTTPITATPGAPFYIQIAPTTGLTTRFYFIGNCTNPIVIDCGAQTVLANGVSSYRLTGRPTTQVEFLRLEPGNNVMTFSVNLVTPVNMSGSIQFRHTWK